MNITAFYADPHFNHMSRSGGIIKLADRPFADIDEMNEALIDRYNRAIGELDTVLWVGDCFFYSFRKAREIMDRLNGEKLLVLGNHDKGASSMAKLGFLVMDKCIMHIAGRACEVNHYPYAGGGRPEDDGFADHRPKPVKGRILIHGHHHLNRQVYKNMIHVGVDAWDFYPAPMIQVEELIRKHFPVNAPADG